MTDYNHICFVRTIFIFRMIVSWSWITFCVGIVVCMDPDWVGAFGNLNDADRQNLRGRNGVPSTAHTWDCRFLHRSCASHTKMLWWLEARRMILYEIQIHCKESVTTLLLNELEVMKTKPVAPHYTEKWDWCR
jgi:hypothetical protein